MNEDFNGADKQHLDHFLRSYERWLIKSCLPLVPSWVSTVHLTLMTIVWSMGIILSGRLSVQNINWLWAFSICVFFQHITDMLDGEVGRKRNSGLMKWGFYMDHFLDYVFLCAIIIGYSFLFPPAYSLIALLGLSVFGGFMVHALLDFGLTNDFKISFHRFGVAEIRYAVIAFNTVSILFGKDIIIKSIPFVLLMFFVLLFAVVHHAQRMFRRMDMDNLRKSHEL